MISDTSTILSMFMNVGFSLRYEVTLVAVLISLWLFGRLAGLHQKPRRNSKLASPSKKQPDISTARNGSKWSASPATKDAKPRELQVQPNSAPAALVGCIEDIDPARLREPSWVVPQVILMCRTQMRQALAIYHAALEAGLKLEDIPANSCQQLFEALVTSAVRTGHMDETMQLLRDLRQLGPGVCSSLFCSVSKLCTSKQLFTECLAVYDFMAEDAAFTLTEKSIWSCLLFSAIEARAYHRCSFFFEHLKASGPCSHKDYGNMVRLASLQGDWQLALKLVQEMRESAIELDSIIYNTSLATCVSAGQVHEARALLEEMEDNEGLADVITYNTLMKGYAKIGSMDKCLEVFEHLKLKSIVPSQVTYGILLDGFINENQLERAAQIFNTMMSEGGTMNTVLFTTLIKGFARAGEVHQAMKVYEQMRVERNVTPDLITFSILIKANCDTDRLEEALQLLEAMSNLKLRPDEVVFNNLLAGCARKGNVKLGKRLYADMIACGIRPSNATFSILIRFFHQCKLLDDAVEMLKNEPVKHKVDPEPRLFLQLIQSCIRERQGRRAVEVYEMLVARSSPTAATHGSMISTCMKLNMFDTAAEMMAIAAARGFCVDAQDANALLESAVKKRKMQVARDIAASIVKLGLRMDPKLLAATCQ